MKAADTYIPWRENMKLGNNGHSTLKKKDNYDNYAH